MNSEINNRRNEQIISPWVTLVTHTVSTPHHKALRDFHSLKVADYVSVLAVTADGRIPLVRQYRPALHRVTLELPSGLLEPGENPEETALRELEEETGFLSRGKIHTLGCMATDTGRLENRLWSFVATEVVPAPQAHQEAELEVVLMTRPELLEAIREGAFDHALHVAVVGLAQMHGHFSFHP